MIHDAGHAVGLQLLGHGLHVLAAEAVDDGRTGEAAGLTGTT